MLIESHCDERERAVVSWLARGWRSGFQVDANLFSGSSSSSKDLDRDTRYSQ